MSTWTQSFTNNKLLPRMEEVVAALEGAPIDRLNPAQKEDYLRLLKLTKMLVGKIRSIDPDLFPRNVLDAATNHVTPLQAAVAAFAQNHNSAHIEQANTYADNLLVQVAAFQGIAPEFAVSAIAETATAFERKISQLLVEVSAKADQLKNDIAKSSQAMDHAKSRLDENNKSIDQQKSRLDKAIADFQGQFSQAEAKRANEFGSALAKHNDQAAAQQKLLDEAARKALALQQEAANAHMESVKRTTAEHIAFLGDRRVETDKIFGAIGSASLSGHFAKTADGERSAANWLRVAALALMVGMIVVALLAYKFSLDHNEVDWRLFAFRLGTTLIIAIPAVYAAQESSKHRLREKKLRTLQIELASIDAYLSLLPKEKQHELKAKLADHFFGREEIPEPTDDVTKHALFDVLKSAVSNLTKSK